MRISTSQQYDGNLKRIQQAFTRFSDVQRQLTTGKRWAMGSEDPISASLAITNRRMTSRLTQFDANLRGAKDYLANTERALSEVSTLVTQAYTMALQGANDALDQTARNNLANQIADLQANLVRLGNSQGSSGQYIFAGHESATKPFTVDSGTTLVFHGDIDPVNAEVRASEYMRTNMPTADTFFTEIYEALEGLKSNLQTGDVIRLSDENVGTLQSLAKGVTAVRADTGRKLQQVDAFSADNRRRIDELAAGLSELEEVDLTEAFVRYQQTETAYQAALQVASQGMRLSLMDFMR